MKVNPHTTFLDPTGQWLNPVQLSATGLIHLSATHSAIRAVITVLQQLEPDPYIDFMLHYYQAGLDKFGADWYYVDQLTVLHTVARLLQPEDYLEIGVFRGRSMSVVASAAPGCRLWGFDLWVENYADLANPGPDFVHSQLKQVGYTGSAKLTSGDSQKTVPDFLQLHPDLYFDLITVDGDHSREGAVRDLQNVLPRLKVGGVLVFDDISHSLHPYLEEVWDETVASNSNFIAAKFTEVGHGVALAIRRDEGSASVPLIKQTRQLHSREAELTNLRQQLTFLEKDRGDRLSVIQQQSEQLHELQRQQAILGKRLTDLQQKLAEVEADRAARLQVIEEQSQRLGIVQGERNALNAQLTHAEADRAARLQVIEEQGQRLSVLEAERNTLNAQLTQAEAERATRLRVIEEQSQRFNLLQGERLALEVELERLKRTWVVRAAKSLQRLVKPSKPSAQPATALQTNTLDNYYAAIREPKFPGGIQYRAGVLDQITRQLRQLGLEITEYTIDVSAYRAYFRAADYKGIYPQYYTFALAEKSLEHFVAAQLLSLQPEDVYIDIASEGSPVPEIYHRLYGCKTYRQDLSYPAGWNGELIGGDAASMPIPDAFADKMALHCSFEHFEGDSDIRFIHEIKRVLKPGGRVCFVPLYLFDRYAIQTDPKVAVPARVQFEADATVYCHPTWANRHGRFYDPAHFVTRIYNNLSGLKVTLYRILNAREADSSCYAEFAMVIVKPLDA